MASDEKPRPPYARYAFKNPYNYAIMGGFASAAVLTGNWWLGLAGAGIEAIWMLFAPDSRLLRKLWWDKQHAEDEDTRKRAELDAKFKLLPESDAMRCLDYLQSVDVDEIERDLRRYHQILDRGEADKRNLAQKNIAVLEKRKEKY